MLKTLVMLAGLAAFTGASIACFGLFSDKDRPAQCEGLTGQAKIDCEQANPPRPR
jgi:hypothetical protein